jgi:hypothetical protein
MYGTAMFVTGFLQALPVERIILFGKAGDAAVIPALDDVLGLTGQDVAG